MHEHATSWRYSAFLSYCHADADTRLAEWLHRAIETYRIPHLLRAGRGARLRPVFQDRKELAAADSLSHEIETALTAAESLIVVCSPRARASRWVRQEVETYLGLGRRKNVILVLLEGSPEQSFPAVDWVDDEPLAADFRTVTSRADRRDELLRVVAGLLGCRFDDLRQREHERRTRLRRIVTAGAASVVVAAAVLTSWALLERRQALIRLAQVRELAKSFIFEFDNAIVALPGSLNARRLVVSKGLQYLSDLAQTTGQDPDLLFDLGSSYGVIAGIQGLPTRPNLGETAASLKSFERGEHYLRAALQAGADPVRAGRALANCLEQSADVLRATGDRVGATVKYEETRALRERMLLAVGGDDSLRATVLLDVAAGQEREGNLLEDDNDLQGALLSFEKSLRTRERAASADPANADVARDLALGGQKVGWVLRRLGRADDALRVYEQALATIRTALLKSPRDGESIQCEAGLLEHLGTLALQATEIDKARRYYSESHARCTSLRERDPLDAMNAERVGGSRAKLGDVEFAAGDFPKAIEHYSASVTARRDACLQDPANWSFQATLMVSLQSLGEALSSVGRHPEAVAIQQEGLLVATKVLRHEEGRKNRLNLLSQQSMLADALRAQATAAPAEDPSAIATEAIRLYQASIAAAEALHAENALPYDLAAVTQEMQAKIGACKQLLDAFAVRPVK